MNLLNLLIFVPILAASLISLRSVSKRSAVMLSLLSSVVILLVTLYTAYMFDPSLGLQMLTKTPWIESYGISYHIGVDTFSLTIMLMLALITPVTFVYMSTRSNKGMFIAMLFAQGGATGALFSLDLILFYLFWEVMLLPIFIMIGLYGSGDKVKVSLRITLYTIFGSIAMLLSILMLGVLNYDATGNFDFDLYALATMLQTTQAPTWVFAGFLVAFFIKIPLFGFHGWLQSTYEASPTPTLVILSGIMAKLGVYALYRFVFTLFPQEVADIAPYMLGFGIFGMLYFGIVALRQELLRSVFAYSSASHMSFIVVGLFTLNVYGQGGALYLITAHALGTVGIFILLALLIEQTHDSDIKSYSGIIHKAPWLGVLFVLYTLSIVGIPGSSGFVAELLIIMGAFKYHYVAGLLAATTLLIAMTFVLWLLQRIMYGAVSPSCESLKDIGKYEGIVLSLLLLVIYFMGIYPTLFLERLAPSLQAASLLGATL